MEEVSIGATLDPREMFMLVLDIGGEGLHVNAWNLNPSPTKTHGLDRGAPIPRLILGRAEAIPIKNSSFDHIIVERTPLREDSLHEIARVISHPGTIVFRHALPPQLDPHRMAYSIIPGRIEQRELLVAGHRLQQTIFWCGERR